MYNIIATTIAAINATGIGHHFKNPLKNAWNLSVAAGITSELAPNSSKTPCTCGKAYNVPTNSITINNANCARFGINIPFIFFSIAVVLSKYSTACCKEFSKEPESSPTLIMFIYINGNTLE